MIMRPHHSRATNPIRNFAVRCSKFAGSPGKLARTALRASIAGGLLGVAACGPEFDPLTREGLWRPQHINSANLALQVANPADLVRGTGTTTSDGQLATVAVERLRTDKLKKLPASDVAEIAAGNSGENNSSGGPTGQ